MTGPSDAEVATQRDAALREGYWSVMRLILGGGRRFGLFLAGAAVANLGRWFLTLAAAVLVYDLSGSTLMVGLVSASQFVPTVLLAPWAGAIADRFDRRRTVAFAQAGVAGITATLAVVVIADVVSVPLVLALMGLSGVGQAFQAPASLALAPLLVNASERDIALSLNSMQFNLARAVGPALGAVVMAEAGIGIGLAVNAAMFLAVVWALVLVRPRQQVIPTGQARLRDAFSAARKSRSAVPLLIAGAVISGASDVANTLTPAVSDRFTGSSDATGYLVSGFGVGATLSALLVYPAIRRLRRQMVGAMATQALGVVVFALAPTLWVAIAGLMISGGGFIAASTRAATLLQDSVPPEMSGRIMSLWTLAFLGPRPLFSLLNGAVADVANERLAALATCLILGLTAVGLHLNTTIRRRRQGQKDTHASR
jgi:Arabinose efflux permease